MRVCVCGVSQMTESRCVAFQVEPCKYVTTLEDSLYSVGLCGEGWRLSKAHLPAPASGCRQRLDYLPRRRLRLLPFPCFPQSRRPGNSTGCWRRRDALLRHVRYHDTNGGGGGAAHQEVSLIQQLAAALQPEPIPHARPHIPHGGWQARRPGLALHDRAGRLARVHRRYISLLHTSVCSV